MKAAGFYIFYLFNWLITLLPLKILYGFSGFFSLVLYYVAGYRKKVVLSNLRHAFPEKTDEELKTIAQRYYRFMADVFVESMKMVHMSPRQMQARVEYRNMELLEEYRRKGLYTIIVSGHYGNWEWFTSLPLNTSYRITSLYKPLKNKHFNRMTARLRAKYGIHLVSMKQALRAILTDKKRELPTGYLLIADQSPVWEEIEYWTEFFHQTTPVYLGPEKLARRYDMPVVFLHMDRKRRGYYTITLEELFRHPSLAGEHEITEAHVRRLEEIIRERPELWVWSHRRWKHKPKVKGA